VLSYDDMDGYADEFFWYARNETNTFAKGFIGGGGVNGDSLDDEDYFAGQISFDVQQVMAKVHGTIDVGEFHVDRWPPGSLSPFIASNSGTRRQAIYPLQPRR
jgi:hypothetical protein